MKNVLLLFTLSFLVLVNVNAQDTTELIDQTQVIYAAENTTEKPPAKERGKFFEPPSKRFNIGGHGGVSSNRLSGNPSGFSTNTNIGFDIGIYANINIFTRLYIQPEITYYYSSYEFNRNIDGISDKVKVHSMQIPVLVGLNAFQNEKIALNIQTGPTLGFIMKVKDNDVGVTKDNFNSANFGWVVNGNLRIVMINIHGGFVAGITNYVGGVRNHSWYAGIGYSF